MRLIRLLHKALDVEYCSKAIRFLHAAQLFTPAKGSFLLHKQKCE